MDALPIVIAVLAWFAIATSAAIALGRAVSLADLKERPEPVPSLVRQRLR